MNGNNAASMRGGQAGALVPLGAPAEPALARHGHPTRRERLISSWILTGDPHHARLAGLSEARIAKARAATRGDPPVR
jgi:hypothetical protein